MSDVSQGTGWWQASDGKWYRPEQHPDYKPPAPNPPAAAPAPPAPNPPTPAPNPPAAAPAPPAPNPPTPAPNPPAAAPAPPAPNPATPGLPLPPTAPAGAPQGAPGFASPPVPGSPAFAFDVKRWTQAERISGIASIVLFFSLFFPWFTYNTGFGTVSVSGLWHGWMYLVLLLCLAIFAFLILRAGFAEMPFTLPLPSELILLIATGVNVVLTVLAFLLKPGGIDLGGVGWGFGAFMGVAAAIVAAVPVAVPVLNARRT